jgi:polygalacturonase
LKIVPMNRKYRIFIITAITISIVSCLNTISIGSDPDSWSKADSILCEITEPSFPHVTFNILDFGAIADGKTLNTTAINNTISQANESGGGTVLIPGGTFLTGAIHLKNNVRLHLEEDATLVFSVDPKDYLPLVLTRWEGVDCYNYSPFIYGYKLENIAITGKGRLDGQADKEHWWPWKGRRDYGWKPGMPSQLIDEGRPLLLHYNIEQVPVEQRIMGEGHYLRPPFIQLYQCRKILLEDFTIADSPFWVIHPLLSENITVRGLRINTQGPNNDGCDPESCKNVLIENCYFNTGDDCIALKSGRNTDGRKWNIPVENVIVRNCMMQNGHGGIVIGSEISGGCKNIFVENCEMSSPELERAIRIKTNSQRGGIVENIFVRNIQVGEVSEAVIRINCRYEPQEGQGNYPPLVRNVYISDITSRKSKYAVHMNGIQNSICINDIFISDSEFSGVEKETVMRETGNVVMHNIKINGMQVKN